MYITNPVNMTSSRARIFADNWLHPIRLRETFGNDHPIEIDLGSGKGRFLLARATAHRGTNFLGIERRLSRVRKVGRKIERQELRNVRLLRMEAYYAVRYLIPPEHISTYYIFFPDPWPKKRHHDHRVFSPLFLDAMHRTLEQGGRIHVATDHLPYFLEINQLLQTDDRFEEIAPFVPMQPEQTDFERYYAHHAQIGRCSFMKQTNPTNG